MVKSQTKKDKKIYEARGELYKMKGSDIEEN